MVENLRVFILSFHLIFTENIIINHSHRYVKNEKYKVRFVTLYECVGYLNGDIYKNNTRGNLCTRN